MTISIVILFVFVTYSNQVCEASVVGSSRVGEIVSGPSSSSVRWFNVVLDLNGILCACEPAWKAKGCRNNDLSVHSSTLGTIVGNKLVRVRPGCSEFLNELSKFANVTIWSSMMKSTTSKICDYLYYHCPIKPLRILGQEDCDRVVEKTVQRRTYYMKEDGTQKDIFLKTLSDHLLDRFNGQYTDANTLVIDDSPIKHMLNKSENVLLLHSWSFNDEDAEEDRVLLEYLLPYLRKISSFQDGLKAFRKCHRSGRAMFYEDRQTSAQYRNILAVIEASKSLAS